MSKVTLFKPGLRLLTILKLSLILPQQRLNLKIKMPTVNLESIFHK